MASKNKPEKKTSKAWDGMVQECLRKRELR